MVTQERLKELVSYNPLTGFLVWNETRRTRKKSAVAGSLKPDGYRRIQIDKTRYYAHRLVWLWVYGEVPSCEIDHVNRERDDNRLCNLRLATGAENKQNRAKQNTNTSGYTGVGWNIGKGKWQSRIMRDGKSIHLGYYDRIEDAVNARAEAKRKYHTFHPEDNNGQTTRF
jgi:hypothetical protein